MNFKEIQDLIRLVSKSKLSEFKLKDGDFQLSIRSEEYNKLSASSQMSPQVPQIVSVTPTNVQPTVVSESANTEIASESPANTQKEGVAGASAEDAKTIEYIEVKSPMVGTFYRAPSPEKSSYVQVGDNIQKDTVVCIIEAMKLFNEIEAEVSGKIVKVLVDDAQPIEYDQPLFLVDPNG